MIEFKEQFITPEMAKQMLSKNIDNRNLKQETIDRYVRDIKSGMWKPNTGEVIKISVNGRVLDGQHRLHAIIQSEMSLSMHVATGLEEAIFDVLDTGLNRSATDVFTIQHVPNATVIPSIIQSHYAVKNKRIKHNKISLTNQLVLEIYNKNAEEWQSIAKKAKNYYIHFSKIVPRSIIGGLYKIFSDKGGQEVADDFFTQLCVGKSQSSDTIIWLRKRLIDDKISNVKLPMPTKYELIIKTWNSFRKKKNLKSLRITGEIEEII